MVYDIGVFMNLFVLEPNNRPENPEPQAEDIGWSGF